MIFSIIYSLNIFLKVNIKMSDEGSSDLVWLIFVYHKVCFPYLKCVNPYSEYGFRSAELLNTDPNPPPGKM